MRLVVAVLVPVTLLLAGGAPANERLPMAIDYAAEGFVAQWDAERGLPRKLVNVRPLSAFSCT